MRLGLIGIDGVSASVAVAMVQIGIVWVLVLHWFMPVPMRMRLHHGTVMTVLMVGVVDVEVLVFHGLVQALVFMLLTAVFTLLITQHDESHAEAHH